MPTAAASFAVGDRVAINGKGAGTVRFAGPHHVEGTPRLGVELDDPTGKNNGTVTGHRYFSCAPGHGALVKPHRATASAAGTFGVDVKGGTDNAAGTMSNMSLGLGDYTDPVPAPASLEPPGHEAVDMSDQDHVGRVLNVGGGSESLIGDTDLSDSDDEFDA